MGQEGRAMMQAEVSEEQLIAWAEEVGPRDWPTRCADFLQSTLELVLFPVFLVTPMATFILAAATVLSFGLLTLALAIGWWIALIILLSSSLLWLKVPLIRPLLLVPGAIFAQLAALFIGCCPDMGAREAKAMKAAICHSWPRSLLLLEPPQGTSGAVS